MVLLSSALLIRTHSLTLLLTSYILLTNPSTLLSSAPLWLLGESMHMRAASFQPRSNPLTRTLQPLSQDAHELLALLALGVVVYALVQAVFAGGLGTGVLSSRSSSSSSSRGSGRGNKKEAEDRRLGEEIHTLHSAQTAWMTLAGLRVVAMGALVGWMYIFHSDRIYGSSSRTTTSSTSSRNRTGLSLLANQVTFTAAMMDMLFWGYLWTVLREEAREVAGKVAWRREEEKDREGGE